MAGNKILLSNQVRDNQCDNHKQYFPAAAAVANVISTLISVAVKMPI